LAASPAELQGVRVVQPPRWTSAADSLLAEVVIANEADQPRTVVVVLMLYDGVGVRLDRVETVVVDLEPGETRQLAPILPPLATPPAELRVRLEPLVR
jgi:hypothetical protein